MRTPRIRDLHNLRSLLLINHTFLFAYVFTDAACQQFHHGDEKQQLSFHHWTLLWQSTYAVCSLFLWTCFPHMENATSALVRTIRHTVSEFDYQFSSLRSSWMWTGKLELLRGKFRGWINLKAVWSVKWSCRAIFSKISFIRYGLLYLRPILGRILDESPRGPSFS